MNDDPPREDAVGTRTGDEPGDDGPDGPDDESDSDGFWGGDAAAVDAGDPAAENVAFVLVGALLTLLALGRVAGLV